MVRKTKSAKSQGKAGKWDYLLSAKSESWIGKTPLDKEGVERLQLYLQRFVAETEAIDSTRQTGGFIDDLSIYTTERASSFFLQMRLGESICFRTFEDPNRLGKALREDDLAADSFFETSSEFVYLCNSSSSALTKRIANLKEFQPDAPRKHGKKRQNKSEFRRLDALFRHLRNAFAHGQYKRIERHDGTVVWALQDSNSRGRVTARFLLNEKTLDSWRGLIINRDKRSKNKK